MILPIMAYGNIVLRDVATEITDNYPGLGELIENMYDTMYNAQGVGLAAPQIGLSIRLFVIDTFQFKDKESKEKFDPVKQIFINPKIIREWGKDIDYEEGCLSIPGIRENVTRPDDIQIEFMDEHFNMHLRQYDSINARVIQHEYDHIEGVLFTDLIKPLKKRLLKKRLIEISKGEVDVNYKMKFPFTSKLR